MGQTSVGAQNISVTLVRNEFGAPKNYVELEEKPGPHKAIHIYKDPIIPTFYNQSVPLEAMLPIDVLFIGPCAAQHW